MTALIDSGTAKNLKNAYTQAVWARPDLRSTLLQTHVAETEAQRSQKNKDKVAAAKKAGSSVVGSPGKTNPASAKKNMSTREAIKAAIDEHSS